MIFIFELVICGFSSNQIFGSASGKFRNEKVKIENGFNVDLL
jgi:hypothetical protein